MIHVLVTVTQQVTDQELDADDSPEIAGSYVVQVKEGSTDPTEDALDTIGIACLNDFSISASTFDPTNVPADANWI
jgi:hypothetical protein